MKIKFKILEYYFPVSLNTKVKPREQFNPCHPKNFKYKAEASMKSGASIKAATGSLGAYIAACLAGLFIFIWGALSADAFNIRPTGTKSGDTIMHFEIPTWLKVWYPTASKIATERFTTPVHERATNIIYGCDDTTEDCTGSGRIRDGSQISFN